MILESSKTNTPEKGKVFLVGAGPGQLGLFTLRGAEIVSCADIIFYDKLLCEQILDLRKPGAEIFFVGKTRANHCVPQDDINALLVKHALDGKVVCRLKGGDPFVFGRGGEEASYLRQHGVEFEVVPGVSSAVAVPAHAGIPVTDRRCASAFSVITGHTRHDLNALDWKHLAATPDTRVFLMGLSNIDEITRRLIENGAPPETPVAVISQGCSAKQKVVSSSLEAVAREVRAANLPSPAIIVVGDVVKLRDDVGWFEKRKLFGKRIMVTRPKHLSAELVSRLQDLGADVLLKPLIRQEPLPAQTKLVETLAQAHWIVFTSANSLPFLLTQLQSLGEDIRALGRAKIGAIGDTSAQGLRDHGLSVHFVPSHFMGETFGMELPDVDGKNVVVVRAKQGRDELAQALVQRGANVQIVSAYETVPEMFEPASSEDVDMVVLTSPSTAQSFAKIYQGRETPVAAVVGPITARAAQQLGLRVVVEAQESSARGLAKAISGYFESQCENGDLK